jgi:hypothetical protein
VADGRADGELVDVEFAGEGPAVDGGDGVFPEGAESWASAPIVVVPDVCEAPTSAETGRCPTTSIPVTIPMATRKTTAALTATPDHRRGRRGACGRRGSRARGSRRSGLGAARRGGREGRGPANWVRA